MCWCGTQRETQMKKFVYVRSKKKGALKPWISCGCQEKQWEKFWLMQKSVSRVELELKTKAQRWV